MVFCLQLFDLSLDPVERVNLIEKEDYQEIAKKLSTQLDTWMKETKDPILNGVIFLSPKVRK